MNSALNFSNFVQTKYYIDFESLLKLMAPKITKSDSHFRKSIPISATDEKLFVTLRYLATGDSFHSLAILFKFKKKLSVIIFDLKYKIQPKQTKKIYNIQ